MLCLPVTDATLASWTHTHLTPTPFKSCQGFPIEQAPNSPPWLPPLALALGHLAPPLYLFPRHQGGHLLSDHSPPFQLCGVSHTIRISPTSLRLWSPTTYCCPGCLHHNSQALVTITQPELLLLIRNPSRAGLAWLPHHEIPRTSTENRGRPGPSLVIIHTLDGGMDECQPCLDDTSQPWTLSPCSRITLSPSYR